MSDFTKWDAKIKALEDFIMNKAPTIVGVEGVKHFKDSFDKGGFTDNSLKKWDEVERRQPESSWYGFQYKGTANRPGRKNRGGKYTNYSPAATTRSKLVGETNNLVNSLKWERRGASIVFSASGAYAKIHNEGGAMKVFGKHAATMPKRQYMGPSRALNRTIEQKLKTHFKRMLL